MSLLKIFISFSLMLSLTVWPYCFNMVSMVPQAQQKNWQWDTQWLSLSMIYLVHSVHGDPPPVFIELIGFTVEGISKDIITIYCCGLFFWLYLFWWCEQKKSPNYDRAFPFGPNIGSIVLFFFSVCMYFQPKNNHSIYIWIWKKHSICDNYLCMYTYHLPS